MSLDALRRVLAMRPAPTFNERGPQPSRSISNIAHDLAYHVTHTPPVDVSAVVRALAIDLQHHSWAHLVELHYHERPVIYVNRQLDTANQRFATAHSLGHVLMHPTRLTSDHRLVESTFEGDHHESEANFFACALLMPEVMIEGTMSRLGRSLTVKQTAALFGVPDQIAHSQLSFFLGHLVHW